MRSGRGRGAVIAALILSMVVLNVPSAVAATPSTAQPPVPQLVWADCGDGFQCTTADVPLDYPFGGPVSSADVQRQEQIAAATEPWTGDIK